MVIAIGDGVCGSIPGPVKSHRVSPTTRHRCDVSSELCVPDAKPRIWIPALVTRFRNFFYLGTVTVLQTALDLCFIISPSPEAPPSRKTSKLNDYM